MNGRSFKGVRWIMMFVISFMLAMAPLSASADAVTLNLGSKHYNGKDHNEFNYGLGYGFDRSRDVSYQLGFYRNSRLGNQSFSLYALRDQYFWRINNKAHIGFFVGVATYPDYDDDVKPADLRALGGALIRLPLDYRTAPVIRISPNVATLGVEFKL